MVANTAVGDALYLSDLCHKVYLIHRQNSFRANTESLTNLKSKKNVHIITPAKVTKIIGEEAMGVFAVQVETNNSIIPNETLHKTSDIPNETLSKTSDIPVSGVFVAVGRQPATDILQGIVPLNEQGYIVADENGRTSLDNFFCSRRCTQQRKSTDYNSRGRWRQCSNQCRKISYCKDLKCYTSTLPQRFGLAG